jgi:hypothetical protein
MMAEANELEFPYSSEHGVPDQIDDLFVEDLWKKSGGQVSQDRIRQIATEIAAEFQDATITSFIPILLRRRVQDRLRMIISKGGELNRP